VSVIAALSLFIAAETVVVISDFGAGPVPPDIFVGGHLLAVDKDFHPLVVQTVWLAQIKHVEAYLAAENILRTEKEPLSVTLGVDVILHEAVVFVVADLLGQEQISRLKSGLKHQRQIIFVLYRLLETATVRLKIHADKHPFVGPGYRTILF